MRKCSCSELTLVCKENCWISSKIQLKLFASLSIRKLTGLLCTFCELRRKARSTASAMELRGTGSFHHYTVVTSQADKCIVVAFRTTDFVKKKLGACQASTTPQADPSENQNWLSSKRTLSLVLETCRLVNNPNDQKQQRALPYGLTDFKVSTAHQHAPGQSAPSLTAFFPQFIQYGRGTCYVPVLEASDITGKKSPALQKVSSAFRMILGDSNDFPKPLYWNTLTAGLRTAMGMRQVECSVCGKGLTVSSPTS